MVYIELVSFGGNEAIYDYMPERKDADCGRVSYDIKTKECRILNKSVDNQGFNYAGHAFKRIKEYASNGDFKKTGLVA